MSDRLTVLTSKSVFTGTGDLPFEGFVAVRGNRIEAVGTKCEVASYLTQADEVVDLGDRTVMPGLIDVHTFYTGWALRTLGSDLSGVADAKEAVSLLRAWKDDHPDCAAAFGHNRWHRMPRTQTQQLCLTSVLAISLSSALHRARRPVFSMLPPVRDTALHRRRAMPRRSGA